MLDNSDYGVIHAVVTSFGYRHGPPPEADRTIDARILHGLDSPGTRAALTLVVAEADDWLRRQEQRTPPSQAWLLRLAVGDEHGQLFAAMLADILGKRLRRAGWGVDIEHRDLGAPRRRLRARPVPRQPRTTP